MTRARPEHPRPSCAVVRDVLSSAMDGESTSLPDVEVERHTAACADCARYAEALPGLARRTRLAAAAEVPDLTAPILVALAEDRERRAGPRVMELRWLVGLAGIVQLTLAVPALVGVVGPDLHVLRELGALQLALAIGFLVAAWQPSRAAGVLPIAAVVAVAAVATAVFDVATGAATVAGELVHLAEIVGVAALWLLQRRSPDRPLPLRAGAEPV